MRETERKKKNVGELGKRETKLSEKDVRCCGLHSFITERERKRIGWGG